ncbi:S46 family peptidase, partial [Pyxidicoccus fallax]|uniref:S46 family peptidase n=1 Tax=Pyxidicoccus fallax TaxID=394095 RepID=UPI0020A6C8A4
ADLARALVKGTKLGDVKVRKALLEGGKAAIDASKDPMIVFARQVEVLPTAEPDAGEQGRPSTPLR